MTQQQRIPALLRGGPHDGELRMLSQPGPLRVPIQPKVVAYLVGDGPPSIEIEVGEYVPTHEDWRGADGSEARVYYYEGPERHYMCVRGDCMMRREKVAWDRRCKVCHERTYPA